MPEDKTTTTFSVPNRWVVAFLLVLFGGAAGGGGFSTVKEIIWGGKSEEHVTIKDYQNDRKFDSLMEANWKKEMRKDVDTLIEQNRRMINLLNKRR